eukprot:543412-Prymnesium_polylepis.1
MPLAPPPGSIAVQNGLQRLVPQEGARPTDRAPERSLRVGQHCGQLVDASCTCRVGWHARSTGSGNGTVRRAARNLHAHERPVRTAAADEVFLGEPAPLGADRRLPSVGVERRTVAAAIGMPQGNHIKHLAEHRIARRRRR